MIIPLDNQLPAASFESSTPAAALRIRACSVHIGETLRSAEAAESQARKWRSSGSQGACVGGGKPIALVKDAEGNLIGLIPAP
jgi:hypothetical protein